jgi:hypothetical protein
MKTLAISAIIALTAGSAFASNTAGLERDLANFPVDVDVASLSANEVAQLTLAVNSADSNYAVVTAIRSVAK